MPEHLNFQQNCCEILKFCDRIKVLQQSKMKLKSLKYVVVQGR